MLSKTDEPIDFSRGLKGEAKRYKISVKEKAFADLIVMGWKDVDAYIISGLYNPIYNKTANLGQMNSLLLTNKNFRLYLEMMEKRAKRNSRKQEKTEEEEIAGNMDMATELSKENQLRELLIAKKQMKVGTPEWLKIVQTIADITQAKKDEIQTEDNTIHYYLPLTCNICELYQAAKRKEKENGDG